METLGVDMASGRASEVIVLPRQSYRPLISGLATGLFVLALLFKLYWLSLPLLALAIASLFAWTHGIGTRHDVEALPIGHGDALPVHWQTERPPSWWAMAFAITADATMFASLLFGALFLWLVAPGWPPPGSTGPALLPALLAVLALVAGAVLGRRAVAMLKGGGSPVLPLGACAAAQLGAALLFFIMAAQVPAPTAHAHQATVFVILAYAGARAGFGALLALYGLWRWHDGYLSALRSLDLRIGRLWHDYAAATGLAALAATALLALLAGTGA